MSQIRVLTEVLSLEMRFESLRNLKGGLSRSCDGLSLWRGLEGRCVTLVHRSGAVLFSRRVKTPSRFCQLVLRR